MIVKLLIEHHMECLSFKGGSSESTLVKMLEISCCGSFVAHGTKSGPLATRPI